MNNKGKKWYRLRRKQSCCSLGFSPCSIQWLSLTKEKHRCSVNSYPYLGDCHSLLLSWVPRHPPFKKQQTLNLRDGPQLDPNVTSPVWIMKGVGESDPSTIQNQICRGFLHCCLTLPCWCPFFLLPPFSVCCLTLCLAWDKYND